MIDGGPSVLFDAVALLTSAEAINDLVDGEGEPDGPGAGSSWTLGKMRFDNSLVPADTIAYYLAVPIER